MYKDICIFDAIEALKFSMKDDDEYAWSWHCNLAMMAYDAGATAERANFAAANFLKLLFDVDTSKSRQFKSLGFLNDKKYQE